MEPRDTVCGTHWHMMNALELINLLMGYMIRQGSSLCCGMHVAEHEDSWLKGASNWHALKQKQMKRREKEERLIVSRHSSLRRDICLKLYYFHHFITLATFATWSCGCTAVSSFVSFTSFPG